jgi:ABC-2 type transport system permease protein
VHKVWAIIRREFVERVRTKWFWVSAVLGPVLFAGVIVFQVMQSLGGGERRIAVVDSGQLGYGTQIVEALGTSRSIRADAVALRPGVLDSLTRLVEAKELNGFLIVSDSLPSEGKAEYRASNLSLQTIEELQRTLNRVVEKVRLEGKGVNPAVVDWAQALRVSLDQKKIARGQVTTENAGQSFILAYVMAILLFMAILLYGVNVMS